ncbi:YqeB family protein [Cellulosimicrobium cellulans]|uniref:YqeB family protein n=1 Tax=Cellulosimicrobium cellulans TaxID=1710 RepID=UPI001112D902|nr:hypothetical protein [Cellulosimicrobium cellulans]
MPDATPAPEPSDRPGEQPAVVGPTTTELAVLWGGAPLLGAGLAYGAVRLAGWYAGLPWAPFQGPAELVDDMLAGRGLLGALVAVALGAAAGLLLAAHAREDTAVVTVAADRASVVRRGVTTEIARAEATDVFVDRTVLVVLGERDGHGSAELAHVVTELEAPRLAAAFRAQGWPWRDEDPHAGAFRRWVAGDPALPPSADAVLRARSAMLEAGKDDDVADLRRELGRLGVVVRDAGKVQHWRPARVVQDQPGDDAHPA